MKEDERNEKAVSAFSGFLSAIMDKGEKLRMLKGDLHLRYIKGDFNFIGEFLTCVLVLENLITRDLLRAGASQASLDKLIFAKKIKKLQRGKHLLARYKNLFDEIRMLRNKFAHELHYELQPADLLLLKRWHKRKFETGHKGDTPLDALKLLTDWCLMTMKLGNDPHRYFLLQSKWVLARMKVKHRKSRK